MSSRFHLAIPVKCIEESKYFYCDLLGCSEGNSEKDWVDINFWMNLSPDSKVVIVNKKHFLFVIQVVMP